MSKKTLPSIKEIKELSGKKILLRASLNVPVSDGVASNQFRIMRALPTINFLRNAGAKVIVVAHIGRESKETLEPVFDVLKSAVGAIWCGSVVGEKVESAVESLSDGDVLLLENLRSDEREKSNDEGFAKELASHADIYVNDAFAASHRSHASLTQLPTLLPAYFGFNFLHEYEELMKAMEPAEPSLFLIGGAKFQTKQPLLEKYASKYTNIFVGGALANDIFKAKGLEIGKSLVSDVDLSGSSLMSHLNLLLPVDVTVNGGKRGILVTTPDDVKPDETIADAGPKTIEMLDTYISEAKTILWNGPLGNYEQGFIVETERLAKSIAGASAHTVVGGGDTIAAIESLGLQEKFGFMSTAGGAMLVFLETGTLPAIEAVMKT